MKKKSDSFLKYCIFLSSLSGVVFFDQITKYWVIENFFLGETWNIVPGFFNFTYVRNTGAAFGLLAHMDPRFRVPFFIVMPVIALISILVFFWNLRDQHWSIYGGVSLIISGALGNLLDRFFYGYVIDFLDFHWQANHFPAFNVADSTICIGVGLLIIDLLRTKYVSHSI